jgi:hypothetical protein
MRSRCRRTAAPALAGEPKNGVTLLVFHRRRDLSAEPRENTDMIIRALSAAFLLLAAPAAIAQDETSRTTWPNQREGDFIINFRSTRRTAGPRWGPRTIPRRRKRDHLHD